MKKVIISALSLSALVAVAAPTVEVLSTSRQEKSRLVVVNYTLDGPAVVTADVQTNRGDGVYVTIGSSCFANVSGDFNRLVDSGTYSASWQPVDSWPGKKLADVHVVLKAWSTNSPPPYMVVDLTSPGEVRYYAGEEDVPGGVTSRVYKTSKMLFRKIEAAGKSFDCGAMRADHDLFSSGSTYDTNYSANELVHRVNLTEDYYIAVFETTQQQYANVCVDNNRGSAWPSQYQGESYPDAAVMPVERLSYTGSSDYKDYRFGMIYKLYGVTDFSYLATSVPTANSVIGQFRSVTGMTVDLPTDAQWEFACRAGCPWPYYDWSASPTNIAFCKACQPVPTAPREVGLKTPNGWGLYDMLGNVSELTRMNFELSSGAEETDPLGGSAGNTFTVRGGAWNSDVVAACRVACRSRLGTGWDYSATGNIGFRLACPARAVR